MPRAAQKGVSKKKKWNQKKKVGVESRSENKGLPGFYIQSYGDPVQRALISRDAWDKFYKTDAGKMRATRMVARLADDTADKLVNLESNYAIKVKTDKDGIADVIKENAVKKALARKAGK